MTRRILIAMLLVSSVSAQTQSPTALIEARGNSVFVNSTALVGKSALFDGDQVKTGADSAVNIVGQGVLVEHVASTVARYERGVIELTAGTVRVATTMGTVTKAGALSIAPVAPTGKYEVSRLRCAVTIFAREGDVILSDKTVLKQGNTLHRVEEDCAVPSDRNAAAAVAFYGGSSVVFFLPRGHDRPHVSPSRP